ncbi:hypothetical protein ASC85_27300 [Pseudomonas sp. Root401]|nr:hypothetical protein ASC85_27300 [Pseudomonas sp. Root401]
MVMGAEPEKPNGISRMPLWQGGKLALDFVGADECNEAAIFPLPFESRAKDQDQKIAGFASSYRIQGGLAPSPQSFQRLRFGGIKKRPIGAFF